MNLREDKMVVPRVLLNLVWLSVAALICAVDAYHRPKGAIPDEAPNNIQELGEEGNYHYHGRDLLNMEVLQGCVCSVNGRQKLCGSSCPCRTYSGKVCMNIMCSCLRFATCRSLYHPEIGYSCPCLGDRTGFNCSVIDRLPSCVNILRLEAIDSLNDQKLTCFPKDGTKPMSPCFDAEDDLVYNLSIKQNTSTIFTLRSEGNETCLWFKRDQRESNYTVSIFAAEMDELYSRPGRRDMFEVRVSVKKNSFVYFAPTFLQFNFDNHPLQKGLNFSLKAVDSNATKDDKITYQILDVSPNSFTEFVHLGSLTGEVFVLKPKDPINTRQIVNIRFGAVSGNSTSTVNTKLNLIFSSPLCQVTEPVWLYTSARYDYSVIADLYCLQKTGLGPFIFQVQWNNSGLMFITNDTQLLASGTPPYPTGSYSLRLNVKDRFGDIGTTNITYVIAPSPELQVRVLNFSTVDVSWQFSTVEIINFYKLTFSGMKRTYSLELTPSTYKQQRIIDLRPLTNYSFQVSAEVGSHHTILPSNVVFITTPRNVSAICTPTYNGSYPSSDPALRCGAVLMNCNDPGETDTQHLVYRFSGGLIRLIVKNVTCLDGKCLFCFPKNSQGNYKLNVTVENHRMDVKYSLPIRLRVPKPPVCDSSINAFTVSELAPQDSIVGRIKVDNPPESGTIRLTTLRPVQWLQYFYFSQDGHLHIRDQIDQLDNMNITLNLIASNRVGHCTVVVVIHVIDENEPPSCNFPDVIRLMHPVTKGRQIVYLNCTDPDVIQENTQISISVQPDPNFAIRMFEVNSTKAIYATADIPLNVLVYNLKVDVQDTASPPGRRTYLLRLILNDGLIQKLTVSFKITKFPRNYKFSNASAEAYEDFSRKFTNSVSKTFQQLKGYLQSEFIRIRPSTTIADLHIMFYQHNQMTSIKAAYIGAIKNGFSNFSIDPNYFQISIPNNQSLLIKTALQVSPRACVGCNVTYMCCAQPFHKNLTFHWSFNGISINNSSDKLELVGLRKRCDSAFGQSQCLTLRPHFLANGTLSCEVSAPDQPTDYFDFSVIPEKPPQVILNSSSQYSFSDLHEEFVVCSLRKLQDAFPVSFTWFLDSLLLNNKDARFQMKKRSASSEVLYIKPLKEFHHISCKVCFGEGVPCSQSNVFFNLEKSEYFCPMDIDNQGIVWPETLAGQNQTIPCPENSTAIIVRMCDAYGYWNVPFQGECVDMSIWQIFSKLQKMKSSKTSMNKQVSLTLESLAKITAKDESLKNHNSLEIGIQALKEFVEISKYSSKKIRNQEAMNFYRTASNLLSTKHKKIWDVLQTKKNGVPKLMRIIGDFGSSIVNKLDNAIDEPIFQTQNLVVQIGQTRSKDIVFPKLDSLGGKSNVFIPEKTLESFLPVNETIGYAAVYYKNLINLLTKEPDSSPTKNDTIKKEVLNSDVLAVTLAHKLPAILNPPIQITFQHIQKNMVNPVCSFWDFHSNVSEMGSWSTNGCKTKYTNKESTICVCNHLTSFAVLMYPMKINKLHTRVLSYITIVGCSLSILGCLLTLAAYTYLWRYIHRHRAIVLIHLCVSLIIADIIFLVGVEQTSSKAWCASIAIILHYVYLVVFFNMLAEGLNMAISVTYVFATKFRTCYLLPMAWGIPAVIVGITMATTRLKGYGNQRFCWLSLEDGMIWAFVAPAVIIMAINMVVIILVFRAMCSTSRMIRKSIEEKVKSGLHGACVLLPVLGLTWLFGIFSVNKQILTFQYLFALLNSMQGLLIFVFHCILNKQIRDAFWKKTASSRTIPCSSPRYQETARRLPSGIPPKTIEQETGFEKSPKHGKEEESCSTTNPKPVNQCYSLNVVLHCRVTSDSKSFSQMEDLQSDTSAENTECSNTYRENGLSELTIERFETMKQN